MKAVLEQPHHVNTRKPKAIASKVEIPGFVQEMRKGMKIGMVNMEEEDDVEEWRSMGEIINIDFDRVSKMFNWTDLFPEWIDE